MIPLVALLTAGAVFCATLGWLLFPATPKMAGITANEAKNDSVLAGFAVRSADKMLSSEKRVDVAVKLSVAGLRVRPAEWQVLKLMVVGILAISGWFLGSWPHALLGGALGWVLANAYLAMKVSGQRKKFEEDMPEMLTLVAGGLRSGLTFQSALAATAETARNPMQSELKRLLSKVQLGVSVEDGLDEVAYRMDSADFGWVAIAVRIQKEVGGNLATILTSVAETLRERSYVRRQVQTLSAEGRMSSYILIALPFLMVGVMSVVVPDYIQSLWSTTLGVWMAGAACVSMLLGFIVMRKIIRIEV